MLPSTAAVDGSDPALSHTVDTTRMAATRHGLAHMKRTRDGVSPSRRVA
jgi:hypothetical protein